MNETGIDLLLEREAVIRVLSRYARGIDRKDAALYRSCLADPIDVHAGQYGGEGLRADAWLKEAFEIAETYTTTQHLITNHEVEFPDGPKGSEFESHSVPAGFRHVGAAAAARTGAE